MLAARGDHGCRVVDGGVARAHLCKALEVPLGTFVEAERLQGGGGLDPETIAPRSQSDGVFVGDDGVHFLGLKERLPTTEDLSEGSGRGRWECRQRTIDVGQPQLLQIELRFPQRGHVPGETADGDLPVNRVDVAHAGGERAPQRQQRADLLVSLGAGESGAGSRRREVEARIVLEPEERRAGCQDDGDGEHPPGTLDMLASDERRGDGHHDREKAGEQNREAPSL